MLALLGVRGADAGRLRPSSSAAASSIVAVLTAIVIATLAGAEHPARAAARPGCRCAGSASAATGSTSGTGRSSCSCSSALPSWQRDGASGLGTRRHRPRASRVAAAALSYRFVEQPIRRLGVRRGASRGSGPDGAPRAPRAIGAPRCAALLVLVAAAPGTVAALASDPGVGATQAAVRGRAAGDPGCQRAPARAETPARHRSRRRRRRRRAVTGARSDHGDRRLGDARGRPRPGGAASRRLHRRRRLAPPAGRRPTSFRPTSTAGTLRPVVVSASPPTARSIASTLEQLRAAIGAAARTRRHQRRRRRAAGPTRTTPSSRPSRSRYRNVELANWHDAAQPILRPCSTRDQIHFGSDGCARLRPTTPAGLRCSGWPSGHSDAASADRTRLQTRSVLSRRDAARSPSRAHASCSSAAKPIPV